MVQIDDQIVTIKSIEDIVEEIKIIIRFLSQTLEGEVKEKEIYNSFETLSNFLIQMPYDSIKKTKIIFFVIEKNNNLLKLAPKTQVTILDINKLYDYYKNDMNKEEFKNYLINIDINALLEAKENLSEELEVLKKRAKKVLEVSSEKSTLFQKLYQLIEDHYLKKLKNYTMKDVEIVMIALNELQIEQNLQTEIEKVLVTEIMRRPNLQEKEQKEIKRYQEKECVKRFQNHLQTIIEEQEKIIKKGCQNDKQIKLDIAIKYFHELSKMKIANQYQELLEENSASSSVNIFGNYGFFCQFLESSNFKLAEKLTIVKKFLKKTLINFDEHSLIITPQEAKMMLEENLDLEELEIYLYVDEDGFTKLWKEKSGSYLQKIVSCLSKEKLKTIIEFKKELYKEEYDPKEDRENFIKAIEILGITPNLCQAFNHLLKKEKEKQEKHQREYKQMPTPRLAEETKARENSIVDVSQKEYKQIFREIERMYNFEENTPNIPLTLEEVVYLISLMYKVNIEEKEIQKSIKNIYKRDLYAYKNQMQEVREYYPKMIYLQDREEINSALEKMVQIGEELMKKSNAEDHFFWRKMFLETFESVRFILKENYEFELEEGRKRNLIFKEGKREN